MAQSTSEKASHHPFFDFRAKIDKIMQMRTVAKKYFFIGCGSVFLLIGLVGIFLPLLPTTPFLILTAICFNRGSEKFHTWLISHPVLSPPILDWQKNRVIKKKYKLFASGMLAISSIFVFSKDSIPLIGKGSYAILLVLLLAFIWSQKSKSIN